MAQYLPGSESVDRSEHLGPLTGTGDNIDAKRVANYGFGTDSNWARAPLPLIDSAWDYVEFTNADAKGNYQTWTFKSGGVGGATIRTLTVSYDANSNITSIGRA